MSLPRPDLRIMISGGGTGGHIFPAIAIANELKKVNDKCEILFVGAKGRMEMEKVPAAGYKIVGLNISGIQRRLSLSNLAVPFKLIGSVWKAFRLVRSFKPDVVVGVGGYASGPLLWAASLLNIPTLIQEQNSYAGITNRILSKRARRICVAYEGMEKYFPAHRILITGNPVRQDILKKDISKNDALAFFGLSPEKKTLLVIGGSLGARTINQCIMRGLEEFHSAGIQLIWQTGKNFIATAEKALEEKNFPGIKVLPFVQRMDLAYTAADVVISRAGAGSVSELAITAKPCILVPSPNVSEDHQTKNAMALVNKSSAILISDKEAPQKLIHDAIRLLANDAEQQRMSMHIAALALPDATENIVKEIYTLSAK